ncbi:MAG: DUF2474 domain-containing protein [Simplicispira sp.]|nr:DUF2474 domain-containing protein [Simplicispira sp.]
MATATTERTRRQKWLRRVGWMVGIWAASVASLWLFSALLRWLMAAAGWATPR